MELENNLPGVIVKSSNGISERPSNRKYLITVRTRAGVKKVFGWHSEVDVRFRMSNSKCCGTSYCESCVHEIRLHLDRY